MRNPPNVLDDRFHAIFFDWNGSRREPRGNHLSLPTGGSVNWVAMFRTSSESNGAEQPVIVGSWTTPGLPVASFAIRSLSNYVVEEGTGKYVRVLPGFDPQAASRVYRRGLEVTTTTYVEGDAGQDPYGGRQGVVVTDQSITDLYNNPGRDIARHIGDFAAKVALWAMHDEAAETRWIVERILAQALGELIDPQTP